MTGDAPQVLIDGLQYCNWSREIFQEMRRGGLTAVHATVGYHEGFRETVRHLVDWRTRFRDNEDLILLARDAGDIERARASNRTAIFLGLQNPMPIEDDIGLMEMLFDLGIRFMQLTYNNQSLLGCGWMEKEDSGVTRMGREAIAEMNRLGMIIDLSHAGERTTLEAIALSERPVVISHANPRWLRDSNRSVSKEVLQALREREGLLGLSLYSLHLPNGSDTTLDQFGKMAGEAAEIMGAEHLGIGSDLCQDQPDSILRWMREGRWTREVQAAASFPTQPSWFGSNLDFPGLSQGLLAAGFDETGTSFVLGGAWNRFIRDSLPSAG
ncbi:membrane dipeptidase [Mesorhizobium sp. M2A.F.Ca.ET.037.01.1.1]|uniref:membrane dipeptidase n=1 Tax=unclassified Mesorhizobium TaxID=325217 RepID=UPI000F75F3FA|nr:MULTISPECIES: membrane dipeptidase [unclassified Mesorhizobium]RUY00523.1 membrane dipeptidase [Mesorhizobium sp. M2A.F.Ca.ET.040.01.1.1]RVC65820.1 membrane dipeptidase [Mesorhizobium sp. M00.F.Ca.ET.038.03.1.1]RVC80151.1 membrane dipeptidase [Mesorhizobium sp. M2A.F.Ca.ET.046.02.1.1]AZO02513.1 membrane dipeptidase [Mesorhizobium sp. M2A.F.Ca.ET.043.02.1.1]AZO37405.1 membrane dipeptidase [Mesorhizobium sp. M2A.F.Ca.ET.046.03.2.1]